MIEDAAFTLNRSYEFVDDSTDVWISWFSSFIATSVPQGGQNTVRKEPRPLETLGGID